jgi:hypothetical protein
VSHTEAPAVDDQQARAAMPSAFLAQLHLWETTEKVRRLGGLFPSGLIRSFFPANQWF